MAAHREIKHLQFFLTNLSQNATRLEEERDSVKSQYEELDGKFRNERQAIDHIKKALDLLGYGPSGFGTQATVDLTGCKSTKERLVRIASANGGLLNIPVARDIILSAGASRAKSHHLGSQILKLVKKNADDWEHVEDRTYRYKPFADQGDAGPREDVEQPHEVWYNRSNENGTTERYERSVVPGQPESRCPQLPPHILDYGQSLNNGPSPSPSNAANGPGSCRLSGSPPDCAQRANRDLISGEAKMSIADRFPTLAPWPGPDDGDEGRQQRGMAIAASTPIIKTASGWITPSQSKPGKHYNIWEDENGLHCGCPDQMRRCKHVYALEIMREREQQAAAFHGLVEPAIDHPLPESNHARAPIPVDPPAPPGELTYWGAYNRTQINEKVLFQRLLYSLCEGVVEPARNVVGRPPVPLRDLIFGEVYRDYAGLSSRRFQTDVKEAAADRYISKPYGYNAGTAFLNDPETTDLLRALITESAKPLREIERTFAADSTGFNTSGRGRWQDEKWGSASPRNRAPFVKTHIMVGVKTRVVTAAVASLRQAADITAFLPLLQETREAGFTVDEVVADTAYLSENVLEQLNEQGIQSWIPFRNNSKFHHDNSLWDRHLATFLVNQELFAEHYYQREQVETAIAMFKTKYKESVRGKTAVSQVNNALTKLVAHNLYVLVHSIYKLGLDPQFAKIGKLHNAAE